MTEPPAIGKVTPISAGPRHRAAYERALPAAGALVRTELVTINLDVPTAVTTVLGKLSGIRSFRAAITGTLPTFDLTTLDRLETYALATAHAHAVYASASASPEPLTKLMRACTSLRDTLHADATALAKRGLVAESLLRRFRSSIGYKSVAFDILGLSALLRRAWPQIEGKTALTLAELDRAELAAEGLLAALGERVRARGALAEVVQLRRRLFTLLLDAWDQARRAISYLRWNEGDLEHIAPSLYAGRRRKSHAPESARLSPAEPIVAVARTYPSWARGGRVTKRDHFA
jgi:hypothetical protein